MDLKTWLLCALLTIWRLHVIIKFMLSVPSRLSVIVDKTGISTYSRLLRLSCAIFLSSSYDLYRWGFLKLHTLAGKRVSFRNSGEKRRAKIMLSQKEVPYNLYSWKSHVKESFAKLVERKSAHKGKDEWRRHYRKFCVRKSTKWTIAMMAWRAQRHDGGGWRQLYLQRGRFSCHL